MEINQKFTRREEVANTLSHLIGAILAVIGLVMMVHHSILRGDGLRLVCSVIFGASMILLYLSSTLTHILPMGGAKDFFFNFDRIAIYFLIAGTYTPLALVTLNGPLGWIIFGVEWGMALVGTILILRKPGDFNSGVNTFYVIYYAIMGWLILVAIVPIIRILPVMGWIWILIGGLCYTFGIIFFKLVKFPYHHLTRHYNGELLVRIIASKE